MSYIIDQRSRVILETTGARGESFADTARRTGAFGAQPGDSDAVVMSRMVEYYSSISGTYYPTVGAGEAATTEGEAFAVAPGDGTVIWYRRTAGGSEQIFESDFGLRAEMEAEFTTLAGMNGTSKIGWLNGGTLEHKFAIEGRSILDAIPFAMHADILDYAPSAADITEYLEGIAQEPGKWKAPPGRYRIRDSILPSRDFSLTGAGARRTYFEHIGTGTMLTCNDPNTALPAGNPGGFPGGAYIDEGRFLFDGITFLVNGPVGIEFGKTRSSFSSVANCYFRHLQDVGGDPRGNFRTGAVAVSADNGPWEDGYATYNTGIFNNLIRGFEYAIRLNDVVNSWRITQNWAISCRVFCRSINSNSLVLRDNYHETGVGESRFLSIGAALNGADIGANAIEMTSATSDSYAYEFDSSAATRACFLSGNKYLIAGDGGGLNNRRITGAGNPDSTWIEHRWYMDTVHGATPMVWQPGGGVYQLPGTARVGGGNGGALGQGGVRFGRAADNADVILRNDGLNRLETDATALAPVTANVGTLGLSTRPWQTGYVQAAITVTSDARDKAMIRDMTSEEVAAGQALRACRKAYKLQSEVDAMGEAAPWHYGYVAQEIAAAFTDAGIDPLSTAALTLTRWTDDDGEPVERYSIRPDQIAALIGAAEDVDGE